MAVTEFKRSSFCESNGCVEVSIFRDEPQLTHGHVEWAFDGELYHVRASGNPDVVLKFTKAEMEAFRLGAEHNEFEI